MGKIIDTDLCIVGGGSAGLSIAATSSRLGVRTVLIESDRMGGDCLNTGCVPSKSLLASANVISAARRAAQFGVNVTGTSVNFENVRQHIRSVISAIEPHDSEARFSGLGCDVIRARARFIDQGTVEASDLRIRARRFVIATGSRAAVPPVTGLREVPFFTNENIFDLERLPEHLIVLGAGPIGCELGRAFRCLGSKVTIVDKGKMLPKDDSDAVDIVRRAFVRDGVSLIEEANIVQFNRQPIGISMLLSDGRQIEGTHLLVAAGRQPNIENLGLEQADIEYTSKGINVNARLQTTNRRVFAAGDVIGGPQFTHWAGYQAGIVIRNALFKIPAKISTHALPWVTFTDPELAQVGQSERECRDRFGSSIRVLRTEFASNDRAQSERSTEGFAKVVTDRKGKILGATIVGKCAGELIQPWCLAVSANLKIGAIAQCIIPYPTFGEINKRVSGRYFEPTLFGSAVRRIVRFLRTFG